MSTKSFSPSQAIGTGWNLTTQNFGYVMQFVFLILVVPQLVGMFFGESDIIGLIVTIYAFFVSLGGIKILLSLVRGKKLPINAIFSQANSFLNALLAAVVSGVAVMFGFIFLIIPGIYMAIRLQYSLYMVVDKKMSGIDAVKASWKLTEGHVTDLFLLGFLSFLVMMLGVIALGVGILIAYPVVALAQAYAYKKLQGK